MSFSRIQQTPKSLPTASACWIQRPMTLHSNSSPAHWEAEAKGRNTMRLYFSITERCRICCDNTDGRKQMIWMRRCQESSRTAPRMIYGVQQGDERGSGISGTESNTDKDVTYWKKIYAGIQETASQFGNENWYERLTQMKMNVQALRVGPDDHEAELTRVGSGDS